VTAVVRTDGLTKDFGAVRAVDRLDLEVRPGEVFGYLGPNGAGKTTTLRLLMDFVRPTAGTFEVFGRPGSNPATRARIGYLPGELHLDPTYTTSDLLEFFGALRGGVDARRVTALLDRFDLDPSRRIGELSSGNRRKVGLVQAFMHSPELLLLDEPTAGLDPLLQREFRALVVEVVAEGTTVVLSSHALHEVEVLAHRVGVLRRGRLVAVAGVDELRLQARQRLDLTLAGAADPAVFAGVSGVVDCTATGDTLHVVVEGSVDAVVKTAATLSVRRLVTHDDDLEDVFVAYYREQEG
jgi:ABC-2 type transport system ATP-binding protein